MATVKLTKRVIDAVSPGEKRTYLWDSEMKGFGLRVAPSGRKVFVVSYRAGGTKRQPVIGAYGSLTVEQARVVARDMLAKVAMGEDPSQDRKDARAAPTVTEVLDRYIEEHAKPHKKALSIYADELYIRKYVKPKLGSRKVASLTLTDIERLHRELRDTPTQANRVVAMLSKVLSLCERWGLRPEHSNPCRHIRRYPERVVHRPLSELGLARLSKCLREAEAGDPPGVAENPRAVGVIRLALFTGMRRGEILALRWDELDLERGVARLADSKTGAKVVRLNSAAREVIAAQPSMLGNPYMFPSDRKPGAHLCDIKGVWKRIRGRAGLTDVRLHDLRHTFAASAAAGGLSLFQIGQLLGHRQPRTTARYSDLVDDPAQRAAEQVGREISGIMNSDK